MTPAPGDRCQRFVGDSLLLTLKDRGGRSAAKGWRALVRTNLGRAEVLRREILRAHAQSLPPAGAAWRDVPMVQDEQGWSLEVPLTEAGYFKAKAYLLDPYGWQHWPEGPDVGISVHPDCYRTTNILYCAFPRLFGPTKNAVRAQEEKLERALSQYDANGYTIIPPSGKLRELTQRLPHIFQTLGCRILHLLPVNPTPTTYARFGRFGSPYAALDLTAIDPALVVFDKRTTGIDQFQELTCAAHLRGGRVFLDIVINHAGWGSRLQEEHPEWFLRQGDGAFASPGAWGVIWEDLVELKHQNAELWDKLAAMFLAWCQRGVDGFRCDAGYKVPLPAWQYIVARVQQEYPETIFLLEGLGGAWEATEALLTEGGLQWAYSELFQNYSGLQVGSYLEHSHRQSRRVGLLVHYSETHDNERLAAHGRAWSLMRNRLCALASVSGGFGFTCGVEWLATEKISVHGSTGLAWGNTDNLLPELTRLNHLLAEHPCFFDGAKLTRVSPADSPVYALLRESNEGKDIVLVLVNTDVEHAHALRLDAKIKFQTPNSKPQTPQSTVQGRDAKTSEASPGLHLPQPQGISGWVDLLGQEAPEIRSRSEGTLNLSLTAGAAYCLAPTPVPRGLHGEKYRRTRAQAAWGLTAMSCVLPVEQIRVADWRSLAEEVERSPSGFLARISTLAHLPPSAVPYPCVITWSLLDVRRITLVPPGHWLLVQDTAPFRAGLHSRSQDSPANQNVESIPVSDGHIACFAPRQSSTEATLKIERYADTAQHIQATIRFLSAEPTLRHAASLEALRPTDIVLLTNGRGGMARICLDLGRVISKYDCVLGANLHSSLPVDRHILVKRLRAWLNADGFISPLDFQSLADFQPGPPAVWKFVAQAGDGRTVEIQMATDMLSGRNTTLCCFSRPSAAEASGQQLPDEAEVRVTVRLDLEDRNFHSETRRNGGAEHHFSTHTASLKKAGARPSSGAGEHFIGFAFTPASNRQLRVFADAGCYRPQPEWSENIPHPVEQSRGQVSSGDAFSPGWFELPLPKGATVKLVVTADPSDPRPEELEYAHATDSPITHHANRQEQNLPTLPATVQDPDSFSQQLLRAARAFVVQRGQGKTVIAGYPWFLDWGRDTFICARGLLAAGLVEDVKNILQTFARFEKDGTLPNTIFGEDASNRETSDAPLWFGLAAEELADLTGPISALGSTLESIARNYIRGTPNGIRMDPASALVWSPSHFTWMDTNYPAGTPREGYPVETQALWIRLLRQLARTGTGAERKRWGSLAAQALASLEGHFWREDRGWYADVLLAKSGQPAAQAGVDDALRCNCLFAVSLGLTAGERARRCVRAAQHYLVVPGALRSLAPLPVTVPLPVHGRDGRLLNNPREPYWGRYEGDEDTRRKPAYHNGTAWTWAFPSFCEALARAWDFAPEAVDAARAYLASAERLMSEGCLGQVPEILDGDAPHLQRGCDAQAWSATEALRVWTVLKKPV
ncbi:MAG TPA: amylo-alpha-1,6-glucosidase [Candidatus Binatia bacterium]|jgi:starch synthase (maltosyl-transferring)|nr:amylo-alpha-1,6-glucosidase [Candidatus Binatia bacterium]